MTHTEALELALEALVTAKKAMSFDQQTTHDRHPDHRLFQAVQSLQDYIHGVRLLKTRNEAIPRLAQPAQPEQEPVAWMYVGTHVSKPITTDEVDYEQIANDDEWFPVYLQPQRTWVGLTDDEIDYIMAFVSPHCDEIDFARAIEAKLKEKNT
jgi:hypothetical protein